MKKLILIFTLLASVCLGQTPFTVIRSRVADSTASIVTPISGYGSLYYNAQTNSWRFSNNGTYYRPVLNSLSQYISNKTLGSGTVFSHSPTINDGITFTFNPSSNVAGMNVGSIAGTPTTTVAGDIYYLSSNNTYRGRDNLNNLYFVNTIPGYATNSIPYTTGLTLTATSTNLTFDGTSMSIGGGSLSASTRLDVRGTGTGTNTIARFTNSANTERLRILDDGTVYFNNSAGTSGQVLTSAGTGAPPTWTTPSGGISGLNSGYFTFATSSTTIATSDVKRYSSSGNNGFINDTSDGFDTESIVINGGGDIGDTRGGQIQVFGNDRGGGVSGQVWLYPGNVPNSSVRILGNTAIGIGYSNFGTGADAALGFMNSTAPSTSPTDMVQLWAEDVSSSSELRVRDEAGNVTTLSPHNFSLIPEGPSEDMAWSYYSEKDGKRINIDMLKAIRILEKLSGEKLVHIVSNQK